MIPSEWVGIGIGVIVALIGQAVTYGMLRQQVVELRAQIGNLSTKENVHALEGRVDNLEVEMREVPKLVTTVAVLETQLKGFKEVYDRDADEMKHGIRSIQRAVETPSFAPRTRKRPASVVPA